MDAALPVLARYVAQLGGDDAFARRVARAGRPCSARAIRQLYARGECPKRDADKFRAAVNEVLVREGFRPSAAWRNYAKSSSQAEAPCGDQPGLSSPDPTLEEQIMTNRTRQPLSTEELRHFGLKADPFASLRDFSDVHLPARLAEVKVWVEHTTKTQDILAITGDYGAGKSTLLRHALAELRNDSRVHLILPDRLDRKALRADGLTLAVLDALCVPGSRVPRSAVERDRLARLQLRRACERGEFPLLVIDEAHDLGSEIFVALKRLWDSGTIFRTLAIVLAGAGGIRADGRAWGLRAAIENDPDLREFAERVTLADLGRLRDELPGYLEWRFKRIGSAISDVFDPQAVRVISERGGTPLLTENIASAAMHEAYLDGAPRVSEAHARAA